MTIAVFGASGYQAGLVLTEMSRRGLDAVLVGRDPDRVATAAAAAGLAGSTQRIADRGDHPAMVTAFDGCDVVLNCAGPFTRTGQAVIRAALAAGCHYVDTAGEQQYTQEVFETFAADAGPSVVPAATESCVPTDLLARQIAEQVGPLDRITASHLLTATGGMSRGSLRSIVATSAQVGSGGLDYRDGHWTPGAPASRSLGVPGLAEPVDMVRFPLLEVVTVPRHVPVGRVEGFVEASLGELLGELPPAAAIDGLPAGPDAAARAAQRFTYLVDAVGADGRAVRGVVRGSDTYGSTAVIAVEAARRLAVDGARPGVLAPAQAFDPAGFLGFLADYGIAATVSDLATSRG